MSKVKLDRQKKIERLEARCHERGFPVTVQRRVIFDALLDREDHPTIDQVYEDVKCRIPGVSRTTVFRTLETLAELGVAKKTSHLQRWPGSTGISIITITSCVFDAIR